MGGGGAPTLVQVHYQFQADGADANTATLLGSEDTSYEIPFASLDTVHSLRVKLGNSGSKGATNVDWGVQFDIDTAGFNLLTTTSTGLRTSAGGDTEGDAMTERLSTTARSYVNGQYEETDGIVDNFSLNNGEDTEHVWSFVPRSADLSGGESIVLKVIQDAAGTPTDLDTYSVTINLTIGAAPKTATGAPNLPLLTASGTAEVIRTSTGAPSLPLLTASGTATVNPADQTATGAPNLPLLTASGTAETIKTATGAANLPLLTASGAAEVEKTSTGAVNLPLLTASGVAERLNFANGSPSLPLLTASGVAEIEKTSTGAPNLPLLTASGTASVDAGGETATGAVSLPLLTASGTATGSFATISQNRHRGIGKIGKMMNP